MKSYEKIEDFLEDNSFRQWVLKEDIEQGKYWQDWLDAHPSRLELFGQAKTILLELDTSCREWPIKRKERAFLNIKEKIQSSGKSNQSAESSSYTPNNITLEKKVRVFISLLLVLLFTFVLFNSYLSEDKDETLAKKEKQNEWIIKTNPKGQKSTFRLSDGSNVVLNAESELRYKNEFGHSHREVYLVGEAFFEVSIDSILPFRVYSGDLITTALGTSFNINSYKENWVEVQLATGKVKVSNAAIEDQTVELVPGEAAAIGINSQLVKSKFDLEKAFYWKEGILVFESIPFREVVQSLERWYATEIIVKNPPTNRVRISGEFKKNTYLKDVLESLGYAYNFNYSIKNKVVFIQFKTSE